MNHTAFFQLLKGDMPGGVYLFHGTEEHVKRSALKRLRDKVLPEGLEALCETVLENPSAADIVAAAETLPMMAEWRLVVVMDSTLLLAGRSKDEANESERLIGYLPKVPDYAIVVFYCHGLVDGRKKLSTALTKQAQVIKFDPLDDGELARWMRATLKAEGKTIENAQAQKLAFTAGRDLTQLTGELHKLAHYLGERTAVEDEDIDAVVTRSLECTVFQLVDALVEGKEAQAFALLDVMREAGEASRGILAMVLRQYRLLLMLKWMQEEGLDRTTQMKRMGVAPFVFERTQRQAKGYGLQQLKDAVNHCINTEYGFKSGRMCEDVALERLMLMLGKAA